MIFSFTLQPAFRQNIPHLSGVLISSVNGFCQICSIPVICCRKLKSPCFSRLHSMPVLHHLRFHRDPTSRGPCSPIPLYSGWQLSFHLPCPPSPQGHSCFFSAMYCGDPPPRRQQERDRHNRSESQSIHYSLTSKGSEPSPLSVKSSSTPPVERMP